MTSRSREEQISDLYAAGESCAEIGRRFDISDERVRQILQAQGALMPLAAMEQWRTQLAARLAEPLARGLSVPDAAAEVGEDRRQADLLIHASNLKRNRGKAWAEQLHAARQKGEAALERWAKRAAKPVLAAIDRRECNLRELSVRVGVANSRLILLRQGDCMPTREMVARLSTEFPELKALLKDA